MQTPEDRFYNPTRINGWFAVSAVLVLATSVAAVLADHYDREWKGYQHSFQALDRKLAGETIALNKAGSGSPKAEAAAIRDRLLERKTDGTPEEAVKADAAHFEKGILETRNLPEFPAGALLAARAYDEQAAKAKTDDLLAKAKEIEKARDDAENARFKAEKEQRELQALVDEFKFEKDHAEGQGHDVEAKIARAEWEEYSGREKQVHDVMDKHFKDKMDRLEDLRVLMTPVTRLSDRARRLDEAAGLVTAERKMRSYVIQAARDAPLVDAFAPVTKIEQKVFPELTVDYNFAQIGRVDRCITCHRGIDKVKVDPETGAVSPLYTAANTPEKVFRTHSRPELFVSSVHSPERIGCTVCHDGLGWGLSFNDAYHMPSTPEQEKEWKEKYHWHKGESWDFPMLPLKHIEASCFKCHRDPVLAKPEDKFAKEIQAAPKWNRGMRLVEDRGCFACHKIDGFAVDGLDKWIGEIPDPEQRGSALATSIRKPGPSLKRVDRKWPSKEAAYKWVWHPKGLRPTTTMPRFFGQPNNSGVVAGVDYDQRTRTEAWGIVSYLWDEKVKLEEDRAWQPVKPPVKGDVEKGKALFGGLDDEDLPVSIGCVACHSTKDFPHPEDGKVNDFGPELSTIGSKTSEAWLYTWLKDPSAAWHGTRMPNLRLTDQEAADLAAYLATLRDEKWEKETPPPVVEDFVKDLALEAVRIAGKKGEENPAAVVEKMPMEERLRRIGERAIGKYACFSCHDIQGFDGKERIGTELGGGEGWGSKDVDRLDFGVMEDPKAVATYASWGAKWLPHRKAEWAFLKLKNPRVFDAGITKQPHEKLLMPNFDFTDDEADAVVTFLLSLQRGEIPGSRRRMRDARETQAEKMKWIARQYNCYGCHTVTREERVAPDGTRIAAARGGDIRPWLGEEKSHWPPTLGGEDRLPEDPANPKKARPTWGPAKSGEGSKVQPAWLYSFLRRPEDPADPSKNMLRYWMTTRMPTFPLTQQELNHLVHGFAAADGVPFPFESKQAEPLKGKDYNDYAEAKALFTAINCFQCHKTGTYEFGTRTGFAPDLAYTGARLRYDWVLQWLHKPSLLQPGTGMPQNWSPARDEKGDVKKDKDGREILMGVDRKTPDGGKFFGDDPQVQMRKVADFTYTLGGKPPESGTK